MKNLIKIFVLACVFAFAVGPVGLDAKTMSDTAAEQAMTQTFTAQIALNPAATSGATLTVDVHFKGLSGFETAELIADVVSNGAALQVTLFGFTGSELPEGITLANITLVDANGQRDFVVVVDGGLVVVTEDLL